MNREQYIHRMADIGYSQEGAENLIWLSKDSSDLVLRAFNFVPTDDGLYEIWLSGDRDKFFRGGPRGGKFLGTLGEAYQYVFADRRTRREERSRSEHEPK